MYPKITQTSVRIIREQTFYVKGGKGTERPAVKPAGRKGLLGFPAVGVAGLGRSPQHRLSQADAGATD